MAGPVTRRQSKRNSAAVIEENTESASKRVKTEDATQNALHIPDTSRETGGSVNINTNDSEHVNDIENAAPPLETSQVRLATTGELFNEYLTNRMERIKDILDTITNGCHQEVLEEFGDVNFEEAAQCPDGGPSAILAEWKKKYAEDKKLASFDKYRNWRILPNKDAQHAIRAIKRCKIAKDNVSDDLNFLRHWQGQWEAGVSEMMKETRSMFNEVIKPLQQHQLALNGSVSILGDEIVGYARRQSS